MKRRNFHGFHEISSFSQKTALFAPKTINIPGAMEGFPPWAGKVRFLAKSSTFCYFSHFSRKTRIFMIFRILGFPIGKHWFGAIQVAVFSRKSCMDTSRVVSFCTKAQNDENEHLLAKMQIFSENCSKCWNLPNFHAFSLGKQSLFTILDFLDYFVDISGNSENSRIDCDFHEISMAIMKMHFSHFFDPVYLA